MTRQPHTLAQLFAEHSGKVSDKWSIYITEYDRLFQAYRDDPVRLLEIGIQNGGSLEIWGKYFTHAIKLIGCDINPDCTQLQFDDPRITVVVADANTDETQQHILKLSSKFDLMIDDGSHQSGDIVRSFARYFTHLNDGGLYIAEDLHCSYWQDFEGGLFQPYSSMAFFKQLADTINHEHWGIDKTRTDLLRSFNRQYNTRLDEVSLAHIHSIEFINSMCVVRKAIPADNVLGPRFLAGTIALVDEAPLPLHGSSCPQANQGANQWATKDAPDDELASQLQKIVILNQAVAEREGEIKNFSQVITEREQAHVVQLTQARQQTEARLLELAEREREFSGQLQQIQQVHEQQKAELNQLHQARLHEIQCQQAEHEWLAAERIHTLNQELHRLQADNAIREQAHAETVDSLRNELTTFLRMQAQREQEIAAQLLTIQQQAEREKAELARMHSEQEQTLLHQHAKWEQDLVTQLTQARQQIETQLLELAEREREFSRQLQDVLKVHEQQNADLTRQHTEREQALNIQLIAERNELHQLTQRWLAAEQEQTQTLNQLHHQLNSMRATYSWRWTVPLRGLVDILKQNKIASSSYGAATIPVASSAIESEPFAHFVAQAGETAIPNSPPSSIITNNAFDMFSAQNNNAATTLDELLSHHDDLFIHNAYLALLGRAPDVVGMNYYLGRLRSGITKIEIIAQIRSGVEGRNRQIHIEGVDEVIRRHNLFKMPFVGTVLRLIGIRDVNNIVKENLDAVNSSKFDGISENEHDVELEYDHNRIENEETRIKDRIAASGLFDVNWYLDHYPDLKNAGVDPLHHYIEHGAFEGRWASAFFHSDYYLNSYIDIAQAKINPLVHYINYGEAEGRKPSRFFDPSWYSEKYGADAKVNNTYLMHFAKYGGFKTNPSPYFDAVRYFVDAPDVMKAGMNPLAHYLSSGIREGRRAIPTEIYPKATETQLVKLKNSLSRFKRVAIFVTYTPDGFLRADIQHYINALAKNDIEVALVIVSDQVRNYIPDEIVAKCSAVLVRENAGFDFGAWAHVIQAMPEVLNANILYLLNDSMIGPVSDIEFKNLLARIDNINAEIVGLTSNNEINSHIQSYFLAIQKKALCSYWLIQYFIDIVNLTTKDDVIFQYELTFTARMKAKGFRCASIVAASSDNINATIYKWSALLDSGIPFVKRSLVSGEHEDKGGELVIEALKKHNYPVELLSIRSPNLVQDKSISVVHLRGRGEFLIEKLNELIKPIEVCKPKADAIINITFISPHNYANGLGVAGRGYISSLMHAKLQYNVHPISKPFHVHAKRGPDWIVNQLESAPDVVIVHINPDGWSGLLDHKEYTVIESARRRIGIFVWELSTLPNFWIKGLNTVDAIIAPSEYCADIFRKYATVPVYVVPHPVPVAALPRALEMNQRKDAVTLRKKNSIPIDARLMLYAFDGSSFLARKNPFALIRAFKSSNLHRMGWHLVLKTKHLFDVPERGEELLKAIGNDKSITIVNNPLTPRDMDLLFDETEIYVSPHCSEGFGLTIAEAMSRGKVVVATDFGGSKDFLDATCGYPVRADIVSLQENYGPYQSGGQWAEIDEVELAAALQQAVEETNCEYASDETSMSSKAIARIKERLSYSAVAEKLEYIVDKVNNDLQYSDRSRGVKSEQ